jgi:hypothetical protein
MVTLAAVALTCWMCSLIALPRKPLPNNEVQELVYARLLGRQHLLMLLALVATAGALLTLVVLARPSRVNSDFSAARRLNAPCIQSAYDPTACATPQPGTRVVRELQDDGKWAVVATFPAPTTGYVRQYGG